MYPLHMPGHKRNTGAGEMAGYMDIDITEIDDYDNLHDAEGIIKDAEERANRLYGADETHFLINGSTCGVLAAVSAAVPKGGKIIAARNVHKSFYHVAYLRELAISFVMPRSLICTSEGLVEAQGESLLDRSDKLSNEKKNKFSDKDKLSGKDKSSGKDKFIDEDKFSDKDNVGKEFEIACEGGCLMGQIVPEDIEKALEENPDAKAVFITSPTYEGVVSDVAAIAEAAHRHGAVLIVDEAHGAHFGLSKRFAEHGEVKAEAQNEVDTPNKADTLNDADRQNETFSHNGTDTHKEIEIPESAIQLGADVVIHSVHKTLGAMTQTALIHVKGDRIDREKLRRFLRIYQSSSPSYVLMASIDSCIRDINDRGEEIFEKLLKYRKKLERETKDLRNVIVMPCEVYRQGHKKNIAKNPNGIRKQDSFNQDHASNNLYGEVSQDPGKVLICAVDGCVTGQQIYDILRLEYKLQCEMAGDTYALAIITGYDTEEGIDRLISAVRDIDKRVSEGEIEVSETYRIIGTDRTDIDLEMNDGTKGKSAEVGKTCLEGKSTWQVRMPKTIVPFFRAWDGETEEVDISRVSGRVAGDFINLYPPGIPLVIPGELIERDLVEELGEYINEGRNVQGVRIAANGARLIRCLKPE